MTNENGVSTIRVSPISISSQAMALLPEDVSFFLQITENVRKIFKKCIILKTEQPIYTVIPINKMRMETFRSSLWILLGTQFSAWLHLRHSLSPQYGTSQSQSLPIIYLQKRSVYEVCKSKVHQVNLFPNWTKFCFQSKPSFVSKAHLVNFFQSAFSQFSFQSALSLFCFQNAHSFVSKAHYGPFLLSDIYNYWIHFKIPFSFLDNSASGIACLIMLKQSSLSVARFSLIKVLALRSISFT